MIGRMQAVFMKLGFQPGTRVAFLTANRADTWCAGSAAQLSRLAITWLHPLGSLDDQLFQLEDSEAQMMVVDGVTFRDRGGELATRASGLKTIFTLGPADYGVDLLQTIEDAGSATARNFAGPDDIATLNYTGGTTGKSKGALRHHRQQSGFANAILAETTLSFLGVGLQPPTPSWGAMLDTGRKYLGQTAWYSFSAGAAIFTAVLSLNLLGDGLRDALDPRLQRGRG
jgi:fatty-acyl-CoA synthase